MFFQTCRTSVGHKITFVKNTKKSTKTECKLTGVDPGGEMTEGVTVGIVSVSGKETQALVNEGLQHGHATTGARLSPVHLSNTAVHLKRRQHLLPVHGLKHRF